MHRPSSWKSLAMFAIGCATILHGAAEQTEMEGRHEKRRRLRGEVATTFQQHDDDANATILPMWLSEEELRSGGSSGRDDTIAALRTVDLARNNDKKADSTDPTKSSGRSRDDARTISVHIYDNDENAVGIDPTSPPGASISVRLPAEYEPTLAVIMTYTSFHSAVRAIAREVAAAGVEVWLVNGPSSLEAAGVPDELYTPLSIPFNSVWARDYGPVGIAAPPTNASPSSGGDDGEEQAAASSDLVFVDTVYRWFKYRRADDIIPCRIAAHQGGSCVFAPLVLDGGNVMSDGAGNLFMTRITYEWNPHLTRDEVDELLRTNFAVETVHILDYALTSKGYPADGTGHIDMFAKIVAECVVVIAQTDDEPYRDVLEAAAAYFEGVECAKMGNTANATTYDVHRVPGWVSREIWYTYTNSLIVTSGDSSGSGPGTVIVPSYKDGRDSEARDIYELALPSTNVVFVNTDKAISYGGSVHCMTRQIPALN